MFKTLNDDQLIEVYRDCLENGLVNQEDANYMTDDRGLMLLVAEGDRYIEVYAKGQRIFRLDYLQNGVDWDEAVVGIDQMSQTNVSYNGAVITIYKEILERKGLRVLQDKKAKYLN
jgi:hypothetical protein